MKERFFIALAIIGFAFVSSNAVDLNTILSGVFREQDRIANINKDAIYEGVFSYIELNDKGDTTKTITSARRIYSKGYDKQKSVYSEMIINGRRLSQSEIERENRKNQSNQKTNLPFNTNFRNDYSFYYIGEDNRNGLKVWQIGFNPNRKGKGFIKGFADVLQADSNIVYINFTPVGLPFVLKDFSIELDYSKMQGFWVPTKFSLQMEVQVKVILSFAHKYIRMQEIYSNYTFNNNLPDSMFRKE